MRRGIIAALAAVSLLPLAACTAEAPAGSPSPTPASPTSSASASGPVTLRFAVYGDEQTVATYQQLASAYTDEHPGVTVRLLHSPDQATAAQQLDRQYARGSAPDLFLVDHEQLPALVAEKRVHPVDELLEQRGVLFGDTYQRLGLEGFSANSALQCMPHDVSPQVVFYNKRLLRPRTLATPEEPAPTVEDGWTWDQFATAARRMSQGRVKGVYIAPRLESLIPLVRSAGSDVMDDPRLPTTLTMADDGTRDALEQVLALVRDRRVTPSVRPDTSGSHWPTTARCCSSSRPRGSGWRTT